MNKIFCFSAHYTTSISTIVAIIAAFFDSQITFCCMQRVDKTHQNTEPDNTSDVDYIMPRVSLCICKYKIILRPDFIV